MLHLRPVVIATVGASRTLRPRREVCAVVLPKTSFVNRSSSSSSSESGSRKGVGKPFEPPRINLDPSNELHQKAARAAQLHEELNSLIDAQAKRRAEELTKPLGSGFVEFLRKSKSEMINIFAAFFCVLLAYQISSMRSGARKLIERSEERDATLKELRRMLGRLGGDDFAAGLAEKCSRALRQEGATSAGSRAWAWGRGGERGGDGEVDRIAGIIQRIVEQEIRSIVGDSALSGEEMEEKRLRELQKQMGVKDKSEKSGGGDLQELIESVLEKEEINDDTRMTGAMEASIVEGEGQRSVEDQGEATDVVKRRKFAGSI